LRRHPKGRELTGASQEGERKLLVCPYCGQTYNPLYMMYCARCGEPVVDAFGRKPKPGPYDGLGSRGGIRARKPAVSAPAPEPEPPHEVGSTQAVEDLIVEYRNHLNEKPADHETRYALALAYMMGHQWAPWASTLMPMHVWRYAWRGSNVRRRRWGTPSERWPWSPTMPGTGPWWSV